MKLEEYGFMIRTEGVRKIPGSGRIQKKEKLEYQTNPKKSQRLKEKNEEFQELEEKQKISDETIERENIRSQNQIIDPISLNKKNECQKSVQVRNNQMNIKEGLIEKRDLFRDITHILWRQNNIQDEVQSEKCLVKQYNGCEKEDQIKMENGNYLVNLDNQQQDQSNCRNGNNIFTNQGVEIVEEHNAQKQHNKIDLESEQQYQQQQVQGSNTQDPSQNNPKENIEKHPLLFNPHDDIDFIGESSNSLVKNTEESLEKSIGLYGVDWKLLETRSAYYKVNPELLMHYKCLFPNFPKKRAILIDWMQEVAASLSFRRDTLQTAVTIIDRFFIKVPYLPQAQLQLIGATALNIAHKLQEVSVLSVDHFVSTCNYEFPRQQFIEMEQRICTHLGYQLCSVSIDVWMNLLMVQWDELLKDLLDTLEEIPKELNLFFKTKDNQVSFYLFSAVCDYLDVAILNINFYSYNTKPLISAFMYISLQNHIQRQHFHNQHLSTHQQLINMNPANSLETELDQLDQIFKTFLISTLGILEIVGIANELEFASQFMALKLKKRQFQIEKCFTSKPNQIIIDPSKLPIYENICSRQFYNIHGREFIGQI